MNLTELSLLIKNHHTAAVEYFLSVDCPLLADRIGNRDDAREYWAEFFKQGRKCIDFRDKTNPDTDGPWHEACMLVKELS